MPSDVQDPAPYLARPQPGAALPRNAGTPRAQPVGTGDSLPEPGTARAAAALIAGVLSLLVFSPGPARSQAPTPAEDAVAARVDGEPILARELQRELKRVVNERQLTPEAARVLRRELLNQLINRRLVLKYLTEAGLAASPQDLEVALSRIRKQLEKQQQTLPEYLAKAGLSAGELRHTLAWQISWQRALERHLTDANLERYFQQHRRDFDGTQLRVAQILFPVEPRGDPQVQAQMTARAREVLDQIRAGTLTFADAARQHSAAPSSSSGGTLGLISRHAPMPEAFSQAAFALEKNAISEPVVTPFGVHLIQCLDVVPGDKTWPQVRGDLERAVMEYLFLWMADRQRPQAKIEILESPN